MLIGIDIVDIDRMEEIIKRTPRFLHRVFTATEVDYCMQKKNPYPSLAARFAAKEAVRKLDAAFVKGVRFHDVEVLVGEGGKPCLMLHGNAKRQANTANIEELNVSLSHSKGQAIAVVCANRG